MLLVNNEGGESLNHKFRFIVSMGYTPLKEIAIGRDGTIVLATTKQLPTSSSSSMKRRREEEREGAMTMVVIKVVALTSELAERRFEMEVENIKTIGCHKYIVKVHVCQTHQLQSMKVGTIVMEYFQSENLMTHYIIHKQYYLQEESEWKEIFRKMSKAVYYLHSKKIAHLDLRPDNFLYDSKTTNLRLCDFFSSCNWISQQRDYDVVKYSTPIYYRSPELTFSPFHEIDHEKEKSIDLAKIDVWAMGVCFFSLLFGFFPFEVKFSGVFLCDCLDYDYEKLNRVLFASSLSLELVNLIRSMLELNSSQRITMMDVVCHPFFRGDQDDQEMNNITQTDHVLPTCDNVY